MSSAFSCPRKFAFSRSPCSYFAPFSFTTKVQMGWVRNSVFYIHLLPFARTVCVKNFNVVCFQ